MSHHWGYVGALSAAVLFGIGTTFNKIVLGNVHPLAVAGLIYFIAGMALILFRLSPLQTKILKLLETPTETEVEISRRDYKILALIILVGSIIAPVLFMYGLNKTTAVNASLLANTEALFTVFIAVLFLKERATKKDYFGILLLMIGAIFITTNGAFQELAIAEGIFGNILIIAACLFWGIDNNLSKFLSKKQDLMLIVALKCLIGGSGLLLLSVSLGISFVIPLISLLYLFFVGAFSIGFSILLFFFALREIGSMKTGVIFSTSSLFGALFAFLMLKEPLTIVQIAAGFLMLMGIYMLYKKPEDD